MAEATVGPDPREVEELRDLLDLMENFRDNDQRARYLLTCNWMRDRVLAHERLRGAVERLRPCSHACVSPCPHTRRFDEVTREVLPPRRVTPYPAETGRT